VQTLKVYGVTTMPFVKVYLCVVQNKLCDVFKLVGIAKPLVPRNIKLNDTIELEKKIQ